jgi:hypothetical protein
MIYTCYDKIYTVLGIGRAPPGLPGPRAPPAWYQALPEQAQEACLLGALVAINGSNFKFEFAALREWYLDLAYGLGIANGCEAKIRSECPLV